MRTTTLDSALPRLAKSASLMRAGRIYSQSGVALVTVLFVLVMLTLLIVGLLVLSKNEMQTTNFQTAFLDARLSSESVLGIVEGQIQRAATSGIDASGTGTHAWASQPGAIRVYDNSGSLVNIYKLYSSDAMSTLDPASLQKDVPDNWRSRPNEFTDLNEPILRDGKWIYPIVDPATLQGKSDPVIGFSSTKIMTPASSEADESLPMPVRWLYIQKDGSLSSDSTIGDPVLRVAFWTDDESSKVNLNTASATNSDSFWDIPRASFTNERDVLALKQPAQNEFNRYPGHPASVSLEKIFPSNFSDPNTAIQKLLGITPRYQWGGSKNATQAIPTAGTPLFPINNNTKVDRLYSTIDEAFYSPSRISRDEEENRWDMLSATRLESRRFFLTTSSRSSDLNLFGQPRVCIWPISAQTGPEYRTPFDNLISFCSTVGGQHSNYPYYFVRKDPKSQTVDWSFERNQKIFSYLQSLTTAEIPGYGGNFLTKYDIQAGGVSGERDQILTEIFDYIRCTNLNDTYGGKDPSFKTYTNTLVNPIATNLDATMQANSGAGWVLPITITQNGVTTRGAGRVPIISEVALWLIQTQSQNPDTASAEAWINPDPPEVQVGLIVETFSPMQGYMPWYPYNFSYGVKPVPGKAAPLITNTSDGLSKPIFPQGTTVGTETPSYYHSPRDSLSQSQAVGGQDGWGWTWAASISTINPFPLRLNPFLMHKVSSSSFASLPAVKLEKSTAGPQKVRISGGDIEIKFFAGATPKSYAYANSAIKAFQTYVIHIPDLEVNLPDAVPPKRGALLSGTNKTLDGWYERLPTTNLPEIFPQDCVEGLALVDGDCRNIAYLSDVPAGYFSAHEKWGSQYAHNLHGSKDMLNISHRGAKGGKYISDVTYGMGAPIASGGWRTDSTPKIPSTITDLVAKGWEGDFDNGLAGLNDGSYLNKTDEGALKPNSTAPYYDVAWKLGDGLFSPLRQVPSAVMFGSLPTGVRRTYQAYSEGGTPANARPWRTLNFCPNPIAKAAHYGLQNPPDYLLLDLFQMPVVEPYAISEPFSTAGRLNPNYEIQPFTYITRKTAMHAALAAQKVTAIKNVDAGVYKDGDVDSTAGNMRYPIDIEQTLKQIDDNYFLRNKIMRSPSEICTIFLIPGGQGVNGENVSSWWDDHKLTGNNSREKPYATLYPLLTTKSNTYTTHVRVQAIKKTKTSTTAPLKFNILSEYRGSIMLERYLDPNSPLFSNASIDPDKASLEKYYQFRTLLEKQFNP